MFISNIEASQFYPFSKASFNAGFFVWWLMIKEIKKKCVKTILAVSGFALLTGCSSMAQSLGELRANIYAPIYEAQLSRYSESAKNNALEYCIDKFKDSSFSDDEYKQAIQPCLKTEYNKQLNFYISQSVKRQNSKPFLTHEIFGEKVYNADECVGAVVNEVCHGSIIPKSDYHKTCYGTMINGQCTGPMF